MSIMLSYLFFFSMLYRLRPLRDLLYKYNSSADISAALCKTLKKANELDIQNYDIIKSNTNFLFTMLYKYKKLVPSTNTVIYIQSVAYVTMLSNYERTATIVNSCSQYVLTSFHIIPHF